MTIGWPTPQARPAARALDRSQGYFRGRGRAFCARAGADALDLDIYDEISPLGITARDVREALAGFDGSTIRLRVNSPGGDVFDGLAIFNDLARHPARVEAVITGVAASAASVIAMAANDIAIAPNAFVMIHNAWALVIGDKGDLLKTAATLGEIDAVLAQTYASRTDGDVAEIARMMDAETWFAGPAAVDAGFADSLLEQVAEPQAQFDFSRFHRPPADLAAASDTTPTVRDLERALRDAGVSRSAAKAILAGGLPALSAQRDAGDPGAMDAALRRLVSTLEGNPTHA